MLGSILYKLYTVVYTQVGWKEFHQNSIFDYSAIEKCDLGSKKMAIKVNSNSLKTLL